VSWAVAIACVCFASSARGQDSLMIPALPFVPHLAPARLVYQASVRRGDSLRVLGERSVTVAPANYLGISAWLLIEQTQAPAPFGLSDSLFVDRTTLRPLHWSTHVDYVQIVAEFRDDSIFGGMTSPAGRRTIVMGMPGTALVTSAMTEAAVPLFPLAPGFSDSVDVVATDLARTTILRGALTVLGEERVTVPAGTFDAWLVTLTTDAGGPTYWVAKKEHIIVRSTRLVPETGAMLTYDLTGIGSLGGRRAGR
jgi:hypothetical protein